MGCLQKEGDYGGFLHSLDLKLPLSESLNNLSSPCLLIKLRRTKQE